MEDSPTRAHVTWPTLAVTAVTSGLAVVLGTWLGATTRGGPVLAVTALAALTALVALAARAHASLARGAPGARPGAGGGGDRPAGHGGAGGRDMGRLYGPTVAAITAAIEARGAADGGHHQRVQVLALALARELEVDDAATLDAVRYGALLHDVGRIALPDAVLLKGEALTPAERELIERHPVLGAELIRHVPFDAPVAETILHHHERWDGSGYPDGLAGERIPLAARLIGVAEAFDSMVAPASYRRSLTTHEALAEVRRCAGEQFDPRVALVLGPALRRLGWLDDDAPRVGVGSVATEALTTIAEGAIARALRRNLASELSAAASFEEALAVAARVAGPLLDADGWALQVPATSQEPPRWVAVGPGMEFVVDGVGPPRRLRVPGATGPVEALRAGPRGDRRCLLLLPLTASGGWSASLLVRCRGGDGDVPGGELLEAVREAMSSHLAQLWRARAAERLAATDSMTGLRNRRALDRSLDRLAAAASAGTRSAPLGILMLDLDRFKGINDHFGHRVGDEALALVGRALADLEHELGLAAYRSGGDEFVVLVDPADEEVLATTAAAIRRRVEGIELRVGDGEVVRLETSVGAALADLARGTVADALHRADGAMFADKRRRARGRRGARPVSTSGAA